jgi:hypothetical protein
MIIETTKNKFFSLVDYCYNQDFLPKDTSLAKNQYISVSAAATVTFIVWRLYRKRNNSNSNIDPGLLPPLVKGGLPLFGHLLELEKNPAQFIRKSTDENGPCFAIQVPGQGKLVVVTGELIPEVMRSNKNFSFNLGIQTLVPAEQVVKESYKHKYEVADISPREKHPGKLYNSCNTL